MLRLFCVSTVSAVLLTVAPSSANPGGIAGYTGKPTTNAPQGQSCNACHSGGAAPQVSITGPTSLKAGETGEYAIVVATGASRASGAVAATSGVMLSPIQGGGLRDSFGELVQDGAKSTSGGQAQFRFRVTAPLSGSTVKLWAVGMGSNGSGTGGDGTAQITKDITVTGGSGVTPDAGASSSGGNSSTSGSRGSSGTDPEDEDDASSDDSPSSSGSSSKRRVSSPAPASACSVSMGGSLARSDASLQAALALLAMGALAVLRRASGKRRARAARA
jgi:hypothetical protein